MSGYLIDNNVVSELTKASPNSGIIAFLSEQDDKPTIFHQTDNQSVIKIQLDSVSPIHAESSYYLFHQGGYVSEYHDRYIAFFR